MENLKNFNERENISSKEIELQLKNLGIIDSKLLKGYVLDIGAGDGKLDKFLSQNTNLKITALDENPPDKKEFKILNGDVRNLPFEDESYDIVISHASIPNIFIGLYSFEYPELSEKEIKNAIEKSFSEIIRVLKPKGEAILAPVAMTENYDSQKIIKQLILKEIEKLRSNGYQVKNDFIRTERNPKNKEKTDFYRITIKKYIDK